MSNKQIRFLIWLICTIFLLVYTFEVLKVNLEGYINGVLDTILIGLLLKYFVKEDEL